jgi:threonine dehydrogenase-like Zn-dependent dehydrogenase
MNRELVLTNAGTVAWRDVPDSTLEAGQVLVGCEHAAEKHGTMAAFFKGYGNARGRWDGEWHLHRPGDGMSWSYPIPLGNMAVGRVEAVGAGVTRVAPGDRVLCYSSFRRRTVAAERSCWRLADDVPWQSAVCADPGLFALGAIRDGGVRLGDRIAIFGLGAIGLIAVQLARAAGATVYAVDPVAERRALACRFGASAACGDGGEDVGLRLKEHTDRLGVDVVLDFSGAVPALQAALRGVAYGGTIVCGAFPPPHRSGLDFGGEAHMNRPRIVFSRACSDPNPDHPRWNETRLLDAVVARIADGTIDGREIVSPVVDFASCAETYALIAADPGRGVKLGVDFSTEQEA